MHRLVACATIPSPQVVTSPPCHEANPLSPHARSHPSAGCPARPQCAPPARKRRGLRPGRYDEGPAASERPALRPPLHRFRLSADIRSDALPKRQRRLNVGRESGAINRSASSVPSRGKRLSSESQRRYRIFLQNQIVNLGLEARFAEILDPAVGRNQRKIRTEQHLALQLSVGVLHQLRREILG
jgi:hypothetical protein